MPSQTTQAEREAAHEVTRVFNRIFAAEPSLAALFPRTPAARYWTGANGHQYQYTTERVNGKFWAQEFKPVGVGSRTGKAKRFKEVRRLGFTKRASAKARAVTWYKAGAQ